MLKLEHVTKKFHIGTPDETTLFDQFSFEVEKGEFVSIVGSNGSGKTTLLNIICGSLPIEGGHVFFQGKDIGKLPHVPGRGVVQGGDHAGHAGDLADLLQGHGVEAASVPSQCHLHK